MFKMTNTSGDGFMTVMVGEGIPMFRQGGMWDCHTIDHSLDITKEPSTAIQGDAAHMEGIMNINHLVMAETQEGHQPNQSGPVSEIIHWKPPISHWHHAVSSGEQKGVVSSSG